MAEAETNLAPGSAESLAEQVHAVLRAAGQTVAVAESLTGGLICAALTGVPGVSETFRGGLVVYATEMKSVLAGVSEQLLDERGAVDGEVAAQLAQGARDRLRATFGLGVTGVAGPAPQDGKAVGTVFIACAGPRGTTVAQLALSGDRADIRTESVREALAMLVRESSAQAPR